MSRVTGFLLALLTLSGVYLYAAPAPTLAYGAIVFAHVIVGVIALGLLVAFARRTMEPGVAPRLAWMLVVLGGIAGLVLIAIGATLPHRAWFWAHVALSTAGAAVFAAERARAVRLPAIVRYAGAFAVFAAVAYGAWHVREVRWQERYRIANPVMPPASMQEEGHGRTGPFFPSSIRTPDGQQIKSSFFMDSKACERCHQDIYKQWSSSAHRFSSFNNQWYRKAIEYMQDVNGIESSKWCGGCHDPALMFSGLMNKPVREVMFRPEGQAGLGCMACHAIVGVEGSMGQGGYTMEYPKLSDLAASEQPMMRFLHDFLVKVNPEPHRRAFIKPFMKLDSAEYCSTCHKVHLDVPVNNYRWIRGFNDYDNWQASGVSGMGARSFYYPPKAQKCVDCHMPKVASNDFGNRDGFVSSHRFPAANTALPVANEDREQLDVVTKFLKNDIVTVDVFALGASTEAVASGAMVPGGELSTTFAVGEEGGGDAGAAGTHREVTPVSAPLNRVDAAVRRGDTARVDVVVRTRKVGHFFPGGTVDSFDVWVELQAVDDKGQVIFWSGQVEDDGKGPVEPGAHFYRSLQVDARGNAINKRNAWATRAVVYVRLIPPGAADTVHYRLKVPEGAGDRITLKAKLHYRKFQWWGTQFAYAGVPDPRVPAEVQKAFDDRPFIFTGDTSTVSGKLKYIPNLPIITLAENEATVRVLPKGSPEPERKVVLDAKEWTRWNDYGIGLLLQGDLRGAEAAFLRVTEMAPKNPDGWVNVGRVRAQEGNIAGAREVVEKALALDPNLARANYFLGRVLKAEGALDEAASAFRKVLVQFPKDRVVRNDLGRVLFLLRRYPEAIREFETTLSIDPEDMTAHYNLMLCYNGLAQPERAKAHQARYLRFKMDESAQAITGPYRQKFPHDNNERQAVHEHESVALDILEPATPRPATRMTRSRSVPPGVRQSN